MSKTMTPEEVQAYLDKYKLPEEISTAVNNAVRLKASDPYAVIASYLNELSMNLKSTPADDDEYDDADDEIIGPEDEVIPPMAGTKRRSQVMAQAIEVDPNWKPPVYEKSGDAKAFLSGVMETNKLMKNLSGSDRSVLVSAFQAKEFDSGVAIITQGAEGDMFYVVEDGECDITIEGKGSVMKVGRGLAFGELALLHGAPRAATVTTLSKCKTWMLDMTTFKMILMGKSMQDSSDYMGFLDSVDLLKTLPTPDKQILAGALKEMEFGADEIIIKEGAIGDAFYIIRDGEVKCTKAAAGNAEVSRRLVRGDYFGELALLSNDTRAATVSACAKTTVLVVDRDTFTRMLGPLSSFMGKEQGRQ